MFSKGKVKSVTVFRPNGVAVYEVGQQLIINEKPSNIRVETIEQVGKEVVALSFSNGEHLEFHNIPFALSK